MSGVAGAAGAAGELEGLVVAPTEPAALRKLGRVALLPEKWGVDFLWPVDDGLAGVQRKEVKDLLASVADGRLGKELDQMQRLAWRVLCVEGVVQWTTEGQMVKAYGQPWTRGQWAGLMMTVQSRGCWVVESAGVSDTARVVEAVMRWTRKSEHRSLTTRPKAVASWGSNPDDRDFGVHVLQGFPGIGVELAGRIWDHFGRLPFVMNVSDEELLKVPGMGKKKLTTLRKVLG